MSDDKPRLLVLRGRYKQEQPQLLEELRAHYDVHVVSKLTDALPALRSETYHAILADVGDFLPLERELVGEKSTMVLNTIGEGVGVIDQHGRCVWSNKRMRGFSPEVMEKIKQICVQARAVFDRQTGPAADGAANLSKKYTFQCEERYYEMMTSPVLGEDGGIEQVVAVVWDATSGRRMQQKIDAIDAAGRELARLESEAISKLAPGGRLQLLQDKIIKYSRDLMHFDHFAVRLLDKRTNKLEVVISQGLPGNALEIDLYAQPEGNGISGYVAATGRSYICHDTEKDPRYVMGLEHCKSSLTVPLSLYDKVVGVFNIESDHVGTFNEDDRQFAEIFARYVAMALNILDLLVVERYTTSGQLADNVVQEMAQPLNDIITEAQTLREEYIGDDNMRRRLGKIVDYVDGIRATVRNVCSSPQRILGYNEEEVEQQTQDKPLKGKLILVADDELNIRTTIAEILHKCGAKVEVCKDGYEATNLLEQERFDLVVSDIKMPYRNGYEIFAVARRHNDDVPVILMTGFGYDPNHSIVRASQEGLSSVLFKPFKVDQLMDEVYEALDVKAPGSEGASQGEPSENEPTQTS